MQLRNGVSYVRRELAGAVFQLCVVGGLILGLVRGLDHPPRQASPCAGGGKGVTDGVMAGMTPILAPCIAGVLLGTVVGYFFAKLIKSGSATARHTSDRSGGRWITARYDGRCERCGNRVLPGDRVFHSPHRRKVTCPAC